MWCYTTVQTTSYNKGESPNCCLSVSSDPIHWEKDTVRPPDVILCCPGREANLAFPVSSIPFVVWSANAAKEQCSASHDTLASEKTISGILAIEKRELFLLPSQFSYVAVQSRHPDAGIIKGFPFGGPVLSFASATWKKQQCPVATTAHTVWYTPPAFECLFILYVGVHSCS